MLLIGKKKRYNSKRLWFSGIAVHLLMLMFIMDLYFKSPVNHGMTPHKSSEPPFAKRLVLFVADGLRAEAIYAPENQERVPYLTNLREKESAWGIVHTHVPTETRPGHVALLGGMYEDPSAIFSGWKSNLVEVDSIINESTYAWSYGSPDIVQIFPKKDSIKLQVESYDASDEDFSGGRSTKLLDEWVFDKVNALLNRSSINIEDTESCGALCESGNVFFLHLLGMDTVGHVHKPESKEYVDNLKYVDEVVNQMVDTFQKFYEDNETVYVFTSDHGMTNWGSHGDGSDHETQTPFIAWGKGIAVKKERQDMEQADMATLMACLIGIPIPINSVGILHPEILAGTKKQQAEAVHANVRQLSEQYFKLRETFTTDIFYQEFPKFVKKKRNVNSILSKLLRMSKEDVFDEEMVKFGTEATQNILQGILYMQNYYFQQKMTCVIAGFFLWILYLALSIQVIRDEDNKVHVRLHGTSFYNKIRLIQLKPAILGVLVHMAGVYYLYYIDSTILAYVYFSFPMFMYATILCNADLVHTIMMIRGQTPGAKFRLIMRVLQFAGLIELLVYGFFYNSIYAVVLVVIALWIYYEAKVPRKICMEFVHLCVALGVCVLLPIITKFNYTGLSVGAAIWVIYYLAFIKKNMDDYTSIYYYNNLTLYSFLSMLPLIFVLSSVLNSFFVATSFDLFSGISVRLHVASWAVTAAAFIIVPFFPTGVMTRFGQICTCFLVPYTLMSGHFDTTFYTMLTGTMHAWITLESYLVRESGYLHYAHFGVTHQPTRTPTVYDEYRKTYFYLALTVSCFFATGNFSTFNSFDPLWTRAFVSSFHPFVMFALIMFKILTPVFIVACAFQAVNTLSNTNPRMAFAMIMLFCDQMVLNFIFLIKNEGSWLEIGMSLSHFIIMEVMVLVLLIFYALAYLLTTLSVDCGKRTVSIKAYGPFDEDDDNKEPAMAKGLRELAADEVSQRRISPTFRDNESIHPRRRGRAGTPARRVRSLQETSVVQRPSLVEQARQSRVVPQNRTRPLVMPRRYVTPTSAPYDGPLLGTLEQLPVAAPVRPLPTFQVFRPINAAAVVEEAPPRFGRRAMSEVMTTVEDAAGPSVTNLLVTRSQPDITRPAGARRVLRGPRAYVAREATPTMPGALRLSPRLHPVPLVASDSQLSLVLDDLTVPSERSSTSTLVGDAEPYQLTDDDSPTPTPTPAATPTPSTTSLIEDRNTPSTPLRRSARLHRSTSECKVAETIDEEDQEVEQIYMHSKPSSSKNKKPK